MGDLAGAKASFERSLRVDPRGESALEGFVTVLRRTGSAEDLHRAAKLERRARSIRERNPYYQQYLATRAREQGELRVAEKRLRRAIALKGDEPEFYLQWKTVLEELGRSRDAERAAKKLERLRARLGAGPASLGS
jgi:cytochrome c-type biogenesis protein CcmH/NrfG